MIALGLPANIANATSNLALLPGAATSALAYRDELGPGAAPAVPVLAILTFAFGLVGSVLLVLTPTETFDILIPWLLLFAFAVMLFGKSAANRFHARVSIRRPTLLASQALLESMAAISAAESGIAEITGDRRHCLTRSKF